VHTDSLTPLSALTLLAELSNEVRRRGK
jgi:hypothetical protein